MRYKSLAVTDRQFVSKSFIGSLPLSNPLSIYNQNWVGLGIHENKYKIQNHIDTSASFSDPFLFCIICMFLRCTQSHCRACHAWCVLKKVLSNLLPQVWAIFRTPLEHKSITDYKKITKNIGYKRPNTTLIWRYS